MVLSLAACGSKTESGDSDTIKIGWVGSLTGEQAAFGTCESQTLKLLVKQQNEAGGILGKQIEVI
jgi:branched-chain amino acid transport system substrate-binding protein